MPKVIGTNRTYEEEQQFDKDLWRYLNKINPKGSGVIFENIDGYSELDNGTIEIMVNTKVYAKNKHVFKR